MKKESKKRRFFTPWEDEKLASLVSQKGNRWKEIAEDLSRDSKSVYDRWHNFLRPGINKTPLVNKEIESLLELHKEYGNKWSKIVNHLPGRTPPQVKNCFHKQKRKNRIRMSVSKLLNRVKIEREGGKSSRKTSLEESPSKKIENEKAELKKIISNAKNELGEDLEFLLEMYLETQDDIEKLGRDPFIEKHLQKLEDSLTRKINKEELETIYQKQKEINRKENEIAEMNDGVSAFSEESKDIESNDYYDSNINFQSNLVEDAGTSSQAKTETQAMIEVPFRNF